MKRHARPAALCVLTLALAAATTGCSSSPHRQSAPPGSNPGPTTASTPAIPPTSPSPSAKPPSSCASHDQTAQLQAILDRAKDGTSAHPTVVRFPPGTCYVVDRIVYLDKRANLVIEGSPGSPVTFYRQGTGACPHPYYCHIFFLRGGANITFTDVDVIGDNTQHLYRPNNAGQAAWWVWGTQGLTLTNDRVVDVWGDFATLGPDVHRSWRWTTNVTITGDYFSGSGRQGISMTGVENVNISHDVVTHAALSDIDVEADSGTGPSVGGVPTYGGAANVSIADNTFGPSGTTFLSNYGSCSENTNISVTHNLLTAGRTFELWSRGCAHSHRTNWTITDNTAHTPLSSPRGAIELTYVDGATVSGNDIAFYSDHGIAVRLSECTNIRITGNHFRGAAQVTGLGLTGQTEGTGLTITGNTLAGT